MPQQSYKQMFKKARILGDIRRRGTLTQPMALPLRCGRVRLVFVKTLNLRQLDECPANSLWKGGGVPAHSIEKAPASVAV